MAEDNIGSGMPDISGIMDIISKNPELLGKAASILGEMKSGGDSPLAGLDPSILGNLFSGGAPSSGSDEKNENDAAESVPTALSNIGRKSKSRSSELLCALKPYLSKERCDVIDYMLNFSKLGDLLGAISPKKGGD